MTDNPSYALERVRRDADTDFHELFFEHASDGFLLLDESRRIVKANWALADMLGTTPAELAGERASDLLAKTGVIERELTFERLLDGDVVRAEHQILRRDGSALPVEISARRIPSGHVAAIVRDVRERNETERALRESEERYRKLVENSPDGILIRGAEEIAFANHAAAKILGFPSPQELAGRRIAAILPPDAHERAREVFRTALENPGTATVVGQRLRRPDGSELDLEATAIPISYRGNPAVQVVVRDVTERARLEAKLCEAQRLQAIGQLASGIAHDFNNILQAIASAVGVLALGGADPSRRETVVREIGRIPGTAAPSSTRCSLSPVSSRPTGNASTSTRWWVPARGSCAAWCRLTLSCSLRRAPPL